MLSEGTEKKTILNFYNIIYVEKKMEGEVDKTQNFKLGWAREAETKKNSKKIP